MFRLTIGDSAAPMLRRFLVIFIAACWLLAGHPVHADDHLQALLAAPQVTVVGESLGVEELNRFYAARDYRPAWNFSGADNSKAFEAFLDSLTSLIDYHGLKASNYPVDAMRKLAALGEEDSKNQLELIVTNTLLDLAHDLHGDRSDLARIYDGWNFRRDDIDIPPLLATAVAGNQLDLFIESITPKNPAYADLAKALKIYRSYEARGGWPQITVGPTLRPNQSSPRAEQVRARLAAEDYLPGVNLPESQGQLYDADLQNAVKAYQLRNGLEADGNLGVRTVEMMNIPASMRVSQIEANMERWRHMPDVFPPERYVLVNIPDASVDIVVDKKSIYRGLVIVGRPDRKTPFINSVVRSMIINPVWHVPTKIARKDILPKLRKDPHYLEKLGFTISGRTDDPYGETIDWQGMNENEFNFKLRQSPGDMNSLGQLKFDFNNDFAVYMHGTPHQELFQKNIRNLSSGCVRLRDPLTVAELLLSDNLDADHKQRWTSAAIQESIDSGKTHWIGFKNPIPIFIVYWTAFNDEAGKINFRVDPYGYDAMLNLDIKKAI